MTAMKPLHDALMTRLTGNAPLMALVQAVYDGEAEADAATPFLVIGAATETPVGVLGRAGWAETVTVTVHTDARDRGSLLTIGDAVHTALSGDFPIDAHTTVRLRQELRDPTSRRMMPMRYRIIAFSTAAT